MAREKEKLKELAYMLIQIIPPGRVTYYESIARILGTSPRAIGAIMSANDKPIIIPCHRVVRKSGDLGGYSLGGSSFKKRLLELEGVEFNGDKVAGRYIVELEDLMDKGEIVAELEVVKSRRGHTLRVRPVE